MELMTDPAAGPDTELQPIYDEMNRRGFFRSDPELQAIGHELRRRNIISDPSQGGLVKVDQDTMGQMGIPGVISSMGVDAGMNDLLSAAKAATAQGTPPPVGGLMGGMNAMAGALKPPPYLASAQNPHDAVTEEYANKWLRNPENTDSDPYNQYQRILSAHPKDRQRLIQQSGFSPVGQLAILREAYKTAPSSGIGTNINELADQAGGLLVPGTTPAGKAGQVFVPDTPQPPTPASAGSPMFYNAPPSSMPGPLTNFRLQYFNTDNRQANAPMQVADALSKNPKDPNALEQLSRMSPVAQWAITHKAGEFAAADRADQGQTVVDPSASGIDAPAYTVDSKTGRPTLTVPSATQTFGQAMFGPEGSKEFMKDTGVPATLAKTVLGFAEPQSAMLLGAAALVPELGGAISAAAKPTLQRIVSGLFAADMLHGSAEAAGEGNYAQAAMNSIMGGLAGLHAAKGHSTAAAPYKITAEDAAHAANVLAELEKNYPADPSLDTPTHLRNLQVVRDAQAVARRIVDTGESPEEAAKVVVNDRRVGPGVMAASSDVINGRDRRVVNQPAVPEYTGAKGPTPIIGGRPAVPGELVDMRGNPIRRPPPVVSEVAKATEATEGTQEAAGVATRRQGPPPIPVKPEPQAEAAAPAGIVIDTDLFGNDLKTGAAMTVAADEYNKIFPGINARVEKVGKRQALVMDVHPGDYVEGMVPRSEAATEATKGTEATQGASRLPEAEVVARVGATPDVPIAPPPEIPTVNSETAAKPEATTAAEPVEQVAHPNMDEDPFAGPIGEGLPDKLDPEGKKTVGRYDLPLMKRVKEELLNPDSHDVESAGYRNASAYIDTHNEIWGRARDDHKLLTKAAWSMTNPRGPEDVNEARGVFMAMTGKAPFNADAAWKLWEQHGEAMHQLAYDSLQNALDNLPDDRRLDNVRSYLQHHEQGWSDAMKAHRKLTKAAWQFSGDKSAKGQAQAAAVFQEMTGVTPQSATEAWDLWKGHAEQRYGATNKVLNDLIDSHGVRTSGVSTVTNQAEMAQALQKHFGLPEEQAQAAAALAQTRAEVWAKTTGKTAEDWFKTRIAGVVSGGDAEGALHQSDNNLVAMHNLSEAKLNHALKMGGLPVPSIAIGRSDHPTFDRFGDITLVGDRDLVTPDRTTKVLGADAYSPRYPTVHYFADEAGATKLRMRIQRAIESLPERDRKGFSQFNLFNDMPEKRVFDSLYNDENIKLLFLKEHDALPEFPTAEDPRHQDMTNRFAVHDAMVKTDTGGPDGPSYYSWLHQLIRDTGLRESEKIYNGRTDSGKRRYVPHTLDEVVKIMQKGFRDGEGFGYGIGSIRANVAPEFKSVKAIQAARDKIVTPEQMEAVKAELDRSFDDLVKGVLPHRSSDGGTFGRYDAVADDLRDMAKGGAETAKYLREQYSPEGLQMLRDFLNKLRTVPTEYFEAKVKRAVGLDEFRGAVVPEGTSNTTINALKAKGLDVRTYTAGDAESRRQAVNELASNNGLLFQGGGDWYTSHLQVALDKLPQERMNAAQVAGWLRKQGVKAEELKWTGFDDFLKDNAGKPITKTQALEFAKQNAVQVREVVKGGGYQVNSDSKYAIPEVVRLIDRPLGEAPNALVVALENDESAFRALTRKFPDLADDEDWATKVIDDAFSSPHNAAHVKYGDKTLPNGKNYRELLLTLPNLKIESAGEKLRKFESQFKRPDGRSAPIPPDRMAEWESLRDAVGQAKGNRDEENIYQSSHWSEPNVLAHARFTDRTGPKGDKILHVEEIQSDWGQAGRKEGFQGDGVRSAPFVTSTEGWTGLAIKRIMKYAADNGYDKVTWSTGDQNAGHYNLQKKVRNIGWTAHNDGSRTVSIEPIDGNDIEFRVLPDGTTASLSGGSSGNEFIGRKLDEIVGQEIAHSILSERSGDLSGSGLTVGGEGMTAYYDKIVPNVMNAIGKKFGVRAGKSEIDVGAGELAPVHSIDITPGMREPHPLFQGEKAAVKFGEDGRALIMALSRPDVSSVLHELGHIFRRDLADSDLKTAELFAGVRGGRWGVASEEKFANAFEAYLREGKAPSLKIQGIFEQFKNWLTTIYKSIRGTRLDVGMSNGMRAVFDRLLTDETQARPPKDLSVVRDSIRKGEDILRGNLNPAARRAVEQSVEADKQIMAETVSRLNQPRSRMADTGMVNPEVKGAAGTQDTKAAASSGEPGVLGSTDNVRSVGNGKVVHVQYAVREASDVLPSHTTAFQPSPGYDQALQNRDRTRGAMQIRVKQMSNDLHPDELAASPNTSGGAPIIGPDGMVEQGNGRAIAVKLAYENTVTDSGRRYKDWLTKNAQQFGIDPADIAEMKRPMLVRVRRGVGGVFGDLSSEDRVKLAHSMGEEPTVQFSDTEMAKQDGSRLMDSGALLFDKNGNPPSMSAKRVIDAFTRSIPVNQLPGLVGKGGILNKDGQARLRRAFLAAVIDDPIVVERAIEDPDSRDNRIANAIADEAPRLASFKAMERAGQAYPLSLNKEMAAAMNLINHVRKTGKSLAEYTQNLGLFEDMQASDETVKLAQFFDANKNSGAAIKNFLKAYTDKAIKAGNPSQASMEAGKAVDVTALRDRLIDEAITAAPPPKTETLFQPGDGSPYVEYGARQILNGVKRFSDWSEAMKKQFGAGIEPDLMSIWDDAHDMARRPWTMPEEQQQAKPFDLANGFDPEAFREEVKRRMAETAAANTGNPLEPKPAEKEVVDPRRLTVLDQVNAVRRAGLLTSPRTINKVLISHGVYLGAEEIARVPAAIADAVLSRVTGNNRTQYIPRPTEITQAAYKAATQGVREALQIARHGDAAADVTKLGAALETSPTNSKLMNAYIDMVSRMHGAAYRPFKVYAAERAIQEIRRIAPGMNQEAIEAAAIEAAETATFLNDNKMHDALKDLKGMADKHLGPTLGRGVIDFLMPIQKVPTNIGLKILEYATGAPYAVVREAFSRAQGNEFDAAAQRRFVQTFGRGSVGLGIMYLGAMLANNGKATAFAHDWREREGAKEAGKPMASVEIGGRWYEVSTVNPVGSLLALGASLADSRVGYTGDTYNDAMKGAGAFASGIGSTAQEFPYMRTLQEMGEASTDRGRRYMAGAALGSFVPTALADTAAQMDTVERRRQSIPDYMTARLPWLREQLPPKNIRETNKLFDPFNSR